MERKVNSKEPKKVRARKPTQPGTKAVSFHLDAPDATSVTLVGDFNSWDPNASKLRQSKSGGWQGTVRLTPGVYQYKFVVNGMEWREDPQNPKQESNSYGTMNSVCEVV